jgi:Protein of unknown function (DUF3551)
MKRPTKRFLMNWKCLRAIVLATIAASAALTATAHADQYKWCAEYWGNRGGGGTNCGFVTYKQCLDAISGVGGNCEPNQFYTGPQVRRSSKQSQRSR